MDCVSLCQRLVFIYYLFDSLEGRPAIELLGFGVALLGSVGELSDAIDLIGVGMDEVGCNYRFFRSLIVINNLLLLKSLHSNPLQFLWRNGWA